MTTLYQRLSANSTRQIRANRFRNRRNEPQRGRLLRRMVIGTAGTLLLVVFWALFSALPAPLVATPASEVTTPTTAAPPVSNEIAKLRASNAALAARIRGFAPQGDYLVIDTAGNQVSLRHGDEIKADMVASCGSGNVLEDPKSGRRWVFDTPRGQFRIRNKLTNPVWMKPDWAFIEEGEAIPRRVADRAEPGMMGDYALGIGNGYFIHGTLYTRLLGRNVSHGCVRLGDKDLEHLYNTLPIGAQVIIF